MKIEGSLSTKGHFDTNNFIQLEALSMTLFQKKIQKEN